ncbi:MAG: MerR family transcriptional regulator [Myxococcota bacterium]|nr:MerR family transcriptional regulator [Myxococcota bacterium]MEC8423638.1 MerR family transcriptional regulator [Myxococcota bacterium]
MSKATTGGRKLPKGGLGPGGSLSDVVAAAAADEPAGTDPAEAAGAAEPSGPIPDKLYFRIGEVAQLVGVDAHVLRYWESEFRMKPHRSASGQRLYRKQDLSRFLRVKHLLHDEGYTIAGARKVLSGHGTPAAADSGRIRAALERVEALRDRIREFRDDIEAQI